MMTTTMMIKISAKNQTIAEFRMLIRYNERVSSFATI